MMYVHFRRLIKKAKLAAINAYENGWSFIGLFIAIIYGFGMVAMELAGEADIISNYWWWFIVTCTTVGYGDYSPITNTGRIIATIVMLGGIATITLTIAKATDSVLEIIANKKRGKSKVKCTDHVVIMGYRKGKTEKLIEEIKANDENECIVLCSADTELNPIGKSVHFIRGELASNNVIKRANVQEANKIIVFGSDDNQTFFTAYAIREKNKSAQMICYLNNEEHSEKINSLQANAKHLNKVILPVNIYLIAQELQDPGASQVLQQMMSNVDGPTLFCSELSIKNQRSIPYGELMAKLKESMNIIVVAVKDKQHCIQNNPCATEIINNKSMLFYLGEKRLEMIEVA